MTQRAPPLHCTPAFTAPPVTPQGVEQKRAGWEHACRLCGTMVHKGEEIYPVLKPECSTDGGATRKLTVNPGGVRATAFSWCHLACAAAHGGARGLAGLERMPCPFYARVGSCAHGDACFYHHAEPSRAQAPAEVPPPLQPLAATAAAAAAAAAEETAAAAAAAAEEQSQQHEQQQQQ